MVWVPLLRPIIRHCSSPHEASILGLRPREPDSQPFCQQRPTRECFIWVTVTAHCRHSRRRMIIIKADEQLYDSSTLLIPILAIGPGGIANTSGSKHELIFDDDPGEAAAGRS